MPNSNAELTLEIRRLLATTGAATSTAAQAEHLADRIIHEEGHKLPKRITLRGALFLVNAYTQETKLVTETANRLMAKLASPYR